MKEKNRFSNLLEHLMDVAEIKNYVMAKELQYDVSYISKWTSGRMLPGAKTEKTVIQGISRCIVAHGTDEGLQTLLENYHVDSYEELEIAIFDNLIAVSFATGKCSFTTSSRETLFFRMLFIM